MSDQFGLSVTVLPLAQILLKSTGPSVSLEVTVVPKTAISDGIGKYSSLRLTSIDTAYGALSGDEARTLTGIGFLGVTEVTFDGVLATDVVVVNSTTITLTTPPGTSIGDVDIVVRNPEYNTGNDGAGMFTYFNEPTIAFIDIPMGVEAGGETRRLTGRGFVGVSLLTVNGVSTTFTVLNVYEIEFSTPPGLYANGLVDIVVSNPPGYSSGSTGNDLFRYYKQPVLTSINNAAGTIDGGDARTLTGSGFTAATSVTFDGRPASSVVIVSDTSITLVTPVGDAGAADIVVRNPYTTSGAGGNGMFTYYAAPLLLSFDSATGTVDGGYTRIITGLFFFNVTGVFFGSTPATSYTVDSLTQVTVVVPAHVSGSASVTVVSSTGTSNALAFTYTVLPRRILPDVNDIIVWACTDVEGSSTLANTGTLGSAANLSVQYGSPILQAEGVFTGGCVQIFSDQNNGWHTPNDTVATSASLQPAFPVTISCWVNPRWISSQTYNIFCKSYRVAQSGWNSPWVSIGCNVNGNSSILNFYVTTAGTIRVVTSPVPLHPGLWHHIGMTYDGSYQKVYVDGDLVCDVSLTGAIDYGTGGPWMFGTNYITGADRGGWLVQDVRVANVARDATYFRTAYERALMRFGEV